MAKVSRTKEYLGKSIVIAGGVMFGLVNANAAQRAFAIPKIPTECDSLIQKATSMEGVTSITSDEDLCTLKLPGIAKKYLEIATLYNEGVITKETCLEVVSYYNSIQKVMTEAGKLVSKGTGKAYGPFKTIGEACNR